MRYTKEIKIALTAICAVILLFYGINFLKGINLFKKSNIYYVSFTDVSGLGKTNPVFANGYSIGTVADIQYDYEHPGNVIVEVEVDKNMHLPAGSHAELVSQMLGGVTMNILLGKGEYLSPGDTIIGAPQVGALQAVSAIVPTIEQLMPKIDSILTSLNTLLANPSLKNTLTNVESMTAELNETSKQINILMTNDIPALTSKLNSTCSNMEALTGKLNKLDFETTINNTNTTLANVKDFTESLNKKINSKDNNIGLLLNDNKLYYSLNNTITSADSLMTDLKGHPKRYVHFSIFGKKDK
ncbi:MAG: MCE family protein [Prevotellaceae bacterium]|nr:MCE family protein [Candidatus Faecinaster equi]